MTATAVKVFVGLACVFRLWTLLVSVRNERRMKSAGAREFGRGNSMALGILHSLIYIAAMVEGFRKGVPLDGIALTGMAVYVFGALGLVFVIRTLGKFWSLKLLIASNHELVVHPLFRALKHPNYFLGVLPELAGFVLLLHAGWTAAIGLPVYLISLWLRIRLEEKVMGEQFAAY